MTSAPSALKIAVCFFGITRSLSFTLPSIESNILRPLSRVATGCGASARIYSHFFAQAKVDNPRSGENGAMAPDEHLLLANDWLRLEPPGACLDLWNFEALKDFRDRWSDGFRSLSNLIHQLHSLRQATLAALEDGADIVIFLRPDLRYHDSLEAAIRRALLHPNRDLVQLPDWQSWAGLNDRFAVVSGTRAVHSYGCRIEQALTFCQDYQRPLHSEELLLYVLDKADIPVRTFSARASRVRLDGGEKEEDFSPPARKRKMKSMVRKLQRRIEKSVGIRRPLRLSPPVIPDAISPTTGQ